MIEKGEYDMTTRNDVIAVLEEALNMLLSGVTE